MVRNLLIHSWEIRLEMIDMALILIVGDEPDACRMLQRILFTEGGKAVEWLEDNLPDLALLDINLRETDGIGLLKILRRSQPRTKTMMITGNPSAETAGQATELGVVDYLVKPVEIDELEERINRALG